MYKVFAFLKRNTTLLSHDEYRAGHVGFHCCNSRRLKNLRGYLVNIWANEDLRAKLGDQYDAISFNEPEAFTDYWDGFPEVYFDDRESWTQAGTPEPTRATADGLSIDEDWTFDDVRFLFDPVESVSDESTSDESMASEFHSHHLHMEEHLFVPVSRPEHKITKVIQFFRRAPTLSTEAFQAKLLEDYAAIASQLPGLLGYVVNFQDENMDAAIEGYYPADSWRFSEAGRAHRAEFSTLFDGATEMHFESIDDFSKAMNSPVHQQLTQLESSLFDALWYVEVDENLIVIPNRDPAPEFYFR